ncbi:MAG: polyprenol monophosphomannose synthase [Elusimicrobia bacterium]|nr:polyprenol monophosphomannose synthase [Elusimicrobiota bacterium]
MTPSPAKIAIFIPTYNEQENVENLCRELRALKLDADIVFMDDCSPDGTGETLDRLSREHPNVRALHRSGKLGIGSAHREGIRWAYDHGYSALVTMDADFTHSPKYIPDFLAAARDCDVVVGSRYLRGESLGDWNLFRKALTNAAHFLTRGFLGLEEDATGAYRLYRLDRIPREVFELARSRTYSFFFESLHLLKLNGFSVRQIPIDLPARGCGRSKMTWADATRSLGFLFELSARTAFGAKSLRIAPCPLPK